MYTKNVSLIHFAQIYFHASIISVVRRIFRVYARQSDNTVTLRKIVARYEHMRK